MGAQLGIALHGTAQHGTAMSTAWCRSSLCSAARRHAQQSSSSSCSMHMRVSKSWVQTGENKRD